MKSIECLTMAIIQLCNFIMNCIISDIIMPHFVPSLPDLPIVFPKSSVKPRASIIVSNKPTKESFKRTKASKNCSIRGPASTVR